MDAKKIVAYYFTSAQRKWLDTHMKDADFTESFAVGQINDKDLPELEEIKYFITSLQLVLISYTSMD